MPTERSITAIVREVKEGNALASAGQDMRKLAEEVDRTEHKFQNFTKDMRSVNTEIEKSSAKVAELRTQIARTGDTSLFGDLRKEEANLQRLRKLAQGLQKDFHEVKNGVDNIPSAGGSLIGLTSPALITGIAALITGAIAPLGAAVAGAVVGTVGTGGIIGGVLAASHDPQVKSALATFGASISDTFFGSGQAFVGPILQALPEVAQSFKNLDLSKTFGLAAPTLLTIIHGVEQFAENVMPGINKVLERAGPFADAAAKGFGDLGSAVAEFLDNVSASPGALEGLKFLFDGLGGTIKALGVLLKWLSDQFHQFNENALSVFTALDKALSVFGVDTGPIHNIRRGLEGLTGETYDSQQAVAAFGGAVFGAGHSMETLADATKKSDDKLADLNKEVADFNKLVDDLIGNSLSVDKAQVDVVKGFKDLAQTLKDNGSAWGTSTDAALANEDAVLRQLSALNDLRQAEIKAGGSTVDANKEFEANVEKLLGMAQAAGISKDALDKLAGTYVVQVELASSLPGIGAAIAAQFKGIEQGGGLAGGGYAAPGTSHPVGEYGMENLTVLPGGGAFVTPVGGRMGGDGASLAVSLSVAPSGDELLDVLLKKLIFRVNGNGGLVASGFKS